MVFAQGTPTTERLLPPVVGSSTMLASFHPAVQRWFARDLGEPTPPQREAWPAIQRGRARADRRAPPARARRWRPFLRPSTRSSARAEHAGALPDESARALHLAAQGAQPRRRQEPAGAARGHRTTSSRRVGLRRAAIRTWVRTGDTTAQRARERLKRPPHIVVTTPESLYILLTSEGGRRMLATVRTVIVDEIHALVRDKRGSHLALSLERLEALVGTRRQLACSASA